MSDSSRNPIRVLVVIGDTHFGSRYSLCPTGYPLPGGPTPSNPIREWIWEGWERILHKEIPEIVGDDPWALIHMGDVIEGKRGKNDSDCLMGDEHDQITLADHVLSPLAERCDKTFIIEGTQFHGGNADAAVGARLGAELNPVTKLPVFEHLYLKVHGCLCDISHHMPVSMRQHTRSSAFANLLTGQRALAAKLGYGVPKVILRAHRHEFGRWEDDGAVMMSSYPWKVLDRYARKVALQDINTVGAMVLDWRNVEYGDLPEEKQFTHRPSPAQQNMVEI